MSDKGIFWKMYAPLAAASVRHLCGVQIGDVRWNGRHVRVGVASRLGMWGGMDAMC